MYPQNTWHCGFSPREMLDVEGGGSLKLVGMSEMECGGERVLSCGELARLAETTLRTVRFYESEGLISSENRKCGANRCFNECELRRLKLILRLRAADFSLARIKDLLVMKSKYGSAPRQAQAFCERVEEHLSCIDSKLRALKNLRDELLSMKQDALHCAGSDTKKTA